MAKIIWATYVLDTTKAGKLSRTRARVAPRSTSGGVVTDWRFHEHRLQGEAARATQIATVLLVDDDDRVRDLTRAILEQEGYLVLDAVDGHHALALADAHAGAIDVLLTDVAMPGMTGGELARRFAGVRPGAPVLFMSGTPLELLAQRRLLAHDAPFLEKPFDVQSLVSALRARLAL